MIDLKFLRENPEVVKQNIKNKFQDHKLPLVDEVIELDAEARKTQQEADDLRAKRNQLSKEIGKLMGQGKKDEAEAVKTQVAEGAARLAELEEKEKELQEKVTKIMMTIPNIIDPSVPIGKVVLPARLMKLMGAEVLFLTNAAGGIQLGMNAGDFMLIKDQIASFVPSPLRGANVDELGVRFPDMSQVYDKELQLLVKKAALGLDIDLKEGTYLQLSGPQFETPKEVAMCRTLGADAVGMSTACEAIAARHMGMRVVGISCISNLACGISAVPLCHEEVQETADRVAPKFKALVTETIKSIGK